MVLDVILKDGIVTDDELALLHDAVLRVLPVDLRSIATFRRRERKAALREEARQRKEDEKNRQREDRERNAPLARADFMVAGATIGSERRKACASCSEGEPVLLVREPSNPHDSNAIQVRTDSGRMLGYVPREEAEFYAELMDDGAKQSFSIKKVIETSSGRIIPVVYGAFYRPEADEVSARQPVGVVLIPSPAALSPLWDTPALSPLPTQRRVDYSSIEATSAVSSLLSPEAKDALKIAPPDKRQPSALRGLLWVFLIVVVILWVVAISLNR
jgi:hypothetical protein